MKPHILTVGETGSPVAVRMMDGTDPLDLGSYTVQVYGEERDGTAWIAETTTGVTEHPTRTFTASATTNRLTSNAHQYENGWQVVLSTSGTLPSGLSAATRYFVANRTPNDFQLTERPGGPVIDISSAGSGTHTMYALGVAQYTFQSADVDTAGEFALWLRAYDGANRPRMAMIPVVVKPEQGW